MPARLPILPDPRRYSVKYERLDVYLDIVANYVMSRQEHDVCIGFVAAVAEAVASRFDDVMVVRPTSFSPASASGRLVVSPNDVFPAAWSNDYERWRYTPAAYWYSQDLAEYVGFKTRSRDITVMEIYLTYETTDGFTSSTFAPQVALIMPDRQVDVVRRWVVRGGVKAVARSCADKAKPLIDEPW